jgi:hypothetical protein
LAGERGGLDALLGSVLDGNERAPPPAPRGASAGAAVRTTAADDDHEAKLGYATSRTEAHSMTHSNVGGEVIIPVRWYEESRSNICSLMYIVALGDKFEISSVMIWKSFNSLLRIF